MRWTIALVILVLISCKEISYKEPQPKGKKVLTEVPGELQGKYLIADDKGQPSKDTLIITTKGYRLGHYDSEDRMRSRDGDGAMLSDSLVLKFYKGYYFVNIQEDPEWLLRVLKQEKNGDILFMTMDHDDNNFENFLERLSEEIKIDSTEVNGKKLYQIDPTPKQLITLINKGYFSKSVFKKVKE